MNNHPHIIHVIIDYDRKKILIGEHYRYAGASPARPAARILAGAWQMATGFEVEEYTAELDRLDPNMEWDEQTGTWQPPEDFFDEPGVDDEEVAGLYPGDYSTYRDGDDWYFDIYDDTNERWSRRNGPFPDSDSAKEAADGMIADAFREETDDAND